MRRAALPVLVVLLIATAGCSKRVEPGGVREVRLNTRPIQIRVPEGWEFVDQGQKKSFLKGESRITLESRWLPYGQQEFAEWGRVTLEGPIRNQQRDVKAQWKTQIDGREAVEIETWTRLDHVWTERMLLVREDRDLIVLKTFGLMDEEMMKAFISIRDSIHFVRR